MTRSNGRTQPARPITSLSLDLDNKWSYMKTHGDSGWECFPSYLDVVVPRVLDCLARHDLKITFFVVGQDASLDVNRAALRALSAAGHEIGNHSFHHEPWLHIYTPGQIEADLALAEDYIENATGQRPVGFRGPGFSFSEMCLRILARRGYLYDATTFPTFLGPLARLYYFLSARDTLDAEQRRQREKLFGTLRDGLRPNRPYRWHTPEGDLVEIPVTTMPLFRAPIHVSYLLYASSHSPALALRYFQTALWLCRATGTAPSMLLHPLDFMDDRDAPELAFFPAMRVPAAAKLAVVDAVLSMMKAHYQVRTMRQHAIQAARAGQLPQAVLGAQSS
jgi:peptidoglycan-N-acetylglucosamine deacetylase